MLYDVSNTRAVIFRPQMPLSEWLKRQEKKPFALINASLYESATVPVGTVIENGVTVRNQGSGFGFGIKDGAHGFGDPWRGWQYYITGYTGIRQNGSYVAPTFKDSYVFDSKLNRIGLGEKDGKLFIVTGNGMTIEGFGKSEPLDSLINLDGGGSRYLYYNGKTVYTSARTPYNAIAFYKNEEDEKMKIYLSPSSQPANTYASGNTNEQVQCRRIADYCKAALERCGFTVRIGAADIDYAGRIADSNAWGADIHVPIHTNAGGGHGTIVFVYSLTEERVKLAKPVFNAVQDINPYKGSYGVWAKKLDECAKTNGKCVYIEAAFHDNAPEAAWIISHAEDIGEAIAKGLCEGTGKPYITKKNWKDEALAWGKDAGLNIDNPDSTMTKAEILQMLMEVIK